MFCASLKGWTKQGNSYFGGHVRYGERDGSSEEGVTRGKTNLTPAALNGTKEANRRNGALGGRWDGCVRAKPRACGAFPSLTWKPSVAQADEDGFSFLSGWETDPPCLLGRNWNELGLGPRFEIGIGLENYADWRRGSEMEPGHQPWTLEPVAGVAGAGTVEFGSIGRIVPTARGGSGEEVMERGKGLKISAQDQKIQRTGTRTRERVEAEEAVNTSCPETGHKGNGLQYGTVWYQSDMVEARENPEQVEVLTYTHIISGKICISTHPH